MDLQSGMPDICNRNRKDSCLFVREDTVSDPIAKKVQEGGKMLDSMVQMQLWAQDVRRESRQEESTARSCKAGSFEMEEAGRNPGGTGRNKASRREGFYERMERIQERKKEREALLAARLKKQELHKRRQEAYEEQLALRKKRQQALDQQFFQKRRMEREENAIRGEMLSLARSADGRLPVSAEIDLSRQNGVLTE